MLTCLGGYLQPPVDFHGNPTAVHDFSAYQQASLAHALNDQQLQVSKQLKQLAFSKSRCFNAASEVKAIKNSLNVFFK